LTDGRGRSLAFTDSIGNDYLGDVTYTQNGGNRAGAIDRSHTFAKSRAETADAPGLSFYRNRYYDQTTGRWTQEDPIGIAGGVNLYQYVGNNPATFTDPFGLRADTLRFESEPLRAVFSSLRGQSPAFDRQMSDMEQSTVVTNVVAGEAFGGHVTPDRIENGRVVEQTITIDPGSVAEARRMFDATGRGPLDIKDVIGHEVGHAASTARTGGRTCPDPDCSVRAENTVRRDRDRPPRTRY
ncbi:MAG: RHS repeat-associated core domain-containing protein, partial [Tepidiformaceae bacterium]